MMPYYDDSGVQIFQGDCLATLRTLPEASVQTCVTSPPYWGLRDYGVEGQLGLEKTPEEYVGKMVDVFREVRRVLKDDGTLWLNLGDSYAGSWGAMSHSLEDKGKRMGYTERPAASYKLNGLKPKDLVGIPWRVAFALQADGWYLRSDIIWHKPNPMPESVTDRPTKSHEYIFLMSKSERYYYDHEAIKEQLATELHSPGNRNIDPFKTDTGHLEDRVWGSDAGRNKRSVWTVATQPYSEAHFATFPPKLIEPCILAGAPAGGVVLDPFHGAGTTAMVSQQLGRKYIGCELNAGYIDMSLKRLAQQVLAL